MLLAVTHDGQVVRQIETEKLLGVPAVLGAWPSSLGRPIRVGHRPVERRRSGARDAARGDEPRLDPRRRPGFGGLGYFRFDDRIRDASKGKASHAAVPMRLLPGTPKLMQSGYAPVGPLADAEDKARAYTRNPRRATPGRRSRTGDGTQRTSASRWGSTRT
jgi:outer membrane protein assembly factor BamB